MVSLEPNLLNKHKAIKVINAARRGPSCLEPLSHFWSFAEVLPISLLDADNSISRWRLSIQSEIWLQMPRFLQEKMYFYLNLSEVLSDFSSFFLRTCLKGGMVVAQRWAETGRDSPRGWWRSTSTSPSY